MKKILGLLATMTLGSTVMTPNIFMTNTATNNVFLYTNDFDLPVRPIVQETIYYCVPASTQMILDYFGVDLRSYSQHRIFQDLAGIPGIGVSMLKIPDYLNAHIPVSTLYDITRVPPDFGDTLFDLIQFQTYVFSSLSNRHPLMLSFNQVVGAHTYVVSGISLNFVRPDLTQYTYINPGDASRHYFTGAYLSTLFRLAGYIVGWGQPT